MFVPVLPCFFVFLVLPQLCHGYIGTVRSAGPRQSLSLLVACRDPRLPPWPAVVPLAIRDPHTATVTSTAQSHPRCPSWVAEDPVSLLSHLQVGLVLLGMPSLGTGSYPVQATDVPAISCPRWTGGSVRYGAGAQSTQQEETEGKNGLVFTPPGCSKLRGRWEHWESTGLALGVCNTAGFLLPPTQIPCGDSSPAVTDRQPLIIMDITSLRSPGKDGMNTLTRAAKCSWRWLVRGVFCCPKGSGRGPLSAAFLFLYAPSVLLLRKLYGGKFLCFRQ